MADQDQVDVAGDTDDLNRCSSAISSGQFPAAERIVRGLLAKYPKHQRSLQFLSAALLRRQPNVTARPATSAFGNAEIEMHLGIVLREFGREADAAIWLEKATAQRPECLPAFLQRAALLRAMRRFDEAESVLRQGLDVAPANPELRMLLGGVELDRGRAVGAKAAFSEALASSPGNPDALMGLAVAHKYEGDFVAAADIYRQILTRFAGHVRVSLSLAACLLELGQRDEGIAAMREVVRKHPDAYPMALRILVAAGRGQFWLKRKAAAEQLGLARGP